ncbi:NADP-binding protein [Gigaspora margarita]|uniref:NADP-binding protein n=1 Tax=Gigaspora margarita TaxID=4874 RepID=A0A8H3X5Y3_GIGMA|nr:NADP-binding protein [Gigaspora margarita]
MKLFLTGGSGFLGRNFIKYVLSRDKQITINALARSSISDEYILNACNDVEDGRKRVRIIRGSINDEAAVREGLNEADVVVHMAAVVQPWGYFTEFEKVNIQGTSQLLSIISTLPQKPRFIYISSFTALLSNHYSKDALPDWAPYSKSKCLAEDLVLKSNYSNVIVLRLGWLWGNDDNVLLPKLKNLSKNPLWLFTPECWELSILHVTNACEAIFLSWFHQFEANQVEENKIYEIEDSEGKIKVEDFMEFYVGAVSNVNPPRPFTIRPPKWLIWGSITFIEWIPFLGYSKRWMFDGCNRESLLCLFQDFRLYSDNAKKELGYVGHVSREQGIQELKRMHLSE